MYKSCWSTECPTREILGYFWKSGSSYSSTLCNDIFMERQQIPDYWGTNGKDKWMNLATKMYGNLGKVENKGLDFWHNGYISDHFLKCFDLGLLYIPNHRFPTLCLKDKCNVHLNKVLYCRPRINRVVTVDSIFRQ